jgi:predicted RNA-binding protein YlxR (DUF448 family)
VVRGPAGELVVGRALPGRGAWVCADQPDCARIAARHGAFTRALRGAVTESAVADLVAAIGSDSRSP